MRRLQRTCVALILLGTTSVATAQAPIVQPGAPGETARELTAEEATDIAVTSHSPDDVRFMQDMIPHHDQAVQMADLVADRTNRPEVVDAAGRITLSQQDEIEFMEQWLTDRSEQVPDPADHAAMHTSHRMAGMATPEQMADLAATEGTDFDRMFLQLMITHHEGAIAMVEELLEQPGSAYDPVLFEFANDVENDQTAEIERMHALLITLSDDPRAGLAAGFEDAGQAMMNLELVASMPKPPGFYDPGNPAELPPERPQDDDEDEAGEEEDAEDGDDTGGRDGADGRDDDADGDDREADSDRDDVRTVRTVRKRRTATSGSARRCSISATRTWPSGTMSCLPAVTTGSTSIGWTKGACPSRSAPSCARAGRATSRSSATC